jgi:hypothetical protein
MSFVAALGGNVGDHSREVLILLNNQQNGVFISHGEKTKFDLGENN